MDSDRFQRWTREFTDRGLLSRRGFSGLAAGATAAMVLAVDAEAKKKKKKKVKTCPPPPTPPSTPPPTPTCKVVCPAGADYCVDSTPWFCGRNCVCYTGTSRTICAEKNVPGCQACTTDAECDSKTGPGSACLATNAFCACGGLPRVCVSPCANPIPIQCS